MPTVVLIGTLDTKEHPHHAETERLQEGTFGWCDGVVARVYSYPDVDCMLDTSSPAQ